MLVKRFRERTNFLTKVAGQRNNSGLFSLPAVATESPCRSNFHKIKHLNKRFIANNNKKQLSSFIFRKL